MRFLDKFFNSIPTSILNSIAIISGIITIITAVPSLHIILIAIIKGTLSFSAIISNIRILPVVLGVLCTYFFFKAVKTRKIQNEIQQAYSDSYYSLLSGYKNVLLGLESTDSEDDNGVVELRFFAVSVLDNLCLLLKTLTRKEISACVKIINPNDNLTFDNATVSTFCRSSNSNPERLRLDETSEKVESIKGNTIYNAIVSPGHSQGSFYECDLKEYVKSLKKKGGEYMNTNPDWQKYYESAVVVPIRFLNRRSPKVTDQDSYTLLGFLCVDSMSRNAFLQSKQAYYTSIIRADADAFAVILWNYKRIIGQKNKHSS